MKTERPRCLFCGSKLAKRTRDTNLRTADQAARGIGGESWITVEQLPQTQEEAARLTNFQITKVWFAPGGQTAAGIYSFRTWDGQSYEARHGHFCKIDCAARFGRHMAERGARI